MSRVYTLAFLLLLIQVAVGPPVDPKKKDKKVEQNESENEELDDFGLEYGRYLQQVVQALEGDKDFAKKLENISAEQIRSGQIAHELEFVKHNIRSKLDELKRIEVDRLRKLIQEQMERSELGLYRDEDGRVLESSDNRRWRTITDHRSGGTGGVGGGDFWLGLDRKGVKLPQHLDIENPHSFEISDLKKLIQSATKDLEELDRKRREEFKKYEMEKELKYRESLKNMTEEERKETEKHHQELMEKHKDHPKVHHPGSKPQLEQVWEEEDHMPRNEFQPKTFFAMHDINSDGHLDEHEVEAILRPEVKKMYDTRNEEDDPLEMEEEYHRMREHVFNETDANKDGLISLEEFLRMTEQQNFEQDEGWKGIDEQTIYSEAELEEFMRQRQMQMQYGNDPRMYYNMPDAQGVPPHINYQQPHPGMQQQQQYHQPAYPPQGHPQQNQGMGQQYQGNPQMQFQGQQFHGVPPQQMQYGVPPQQQQYYQGGQQHQGGMPQQQFHAGAGHPQMHNGIPVQGGGAPPHNAVPQQGNAAQHQFQTGQNQFNHDLKPQGNAAQHQFQTGQNQFNHDLKPQQGNQHQFQTGQKQFNHDVKPPQGQPIKPVEGHEKKVQEAASQNEIPQPVKQKPQEQTQTQN